MILFFDLELQQYWIGYLVSIIYILCSTEKLIKVLCKYGYNNGIWKGGMFSKNVGWLRVSVDLTTKKKRSHSTHSLDNLP
jgi:hypothetical protein